MRGGCERGEERRDFPRFVRSWVVRRQPRARANRPPIASCYDLRITLG
ncbi:hypothetical protein Tharo_2745 [Thauera aromatica K172]|uniref:Uncharacterized protein n=1 Tax=Thauera aromatica K172 TaxID=44139 RepID=A0A2R4BQL5_THAAR|nr:hypothetical protein Tharo_2745 [Thauera aromatica K172]